MRMRPLLVLCVAVMALATLPAHAQERDEMGCQTGYDGFIYHMTEGGYQRGQGRIPEALFHFDCALQQNPTNMLAYRQRGAVHLTAANYQAAITDMTLVIDANPNDTLALNGRGFALLRMGTLDPAIGDFTRALQIDPNYARAYNNRGIAYETRGNFADAILDYERAAELGHDPPHFPHWNLANLYVRQAKPRDAINALQRVVQLTPSFTAAYKLMGDLYLELGDTVMAEARYLDYVNLTNTADTSALEYITAMRTRQALQRYAPSVVMVLIVTYLGGRGLWVFFRRRRAPAPDSA